MQLIFNSEFYKVIHRRGVWLCFLVAVFAGLLLGFISFSSLNPAVTGVKNLAYEFIVLQGSNIYNFLFIFTLIVPAIIVTSEFNDNTLKTILFSGTSKFYTMIAKIILCWSVLLFISVLIVLSGSALLGVRFGFDLLFSLEPLQTLLSFIGKISLIFFAYSSLYCFIGVMAQNLILSIALSYGVRLAEALLAITANNNKSLKWINEFVVANYDFYLTREMNDTAIKSMLFCAIIIVVFACISSVAFVKKDIK